MATPEYWHNPDLVRYAPPRRNVRGLVLCVLLVAVTVGAIFFAMNRYASGHSTTAGIGRVAPMPTPQVVETKKGVYRFAEADFEARFPNAPAASSKTAFVSGLANTLRFYSAAHTVVEEAYFGLDLTVSDQLSALAGTVNGLRSAVNLTVTDVRQIHFHQQDARRIALRAGNGMRFTAVAVVYPPRRLYLLMAPAGQPFNTLVKSFRATG